MSDRIAVFNDGRIEQIGPPAEVYEHPASEFIAGFVGVSNVIERDGRRVTVRPEKIRVLDEGEQPEAGAHVEEGIVRDVAVRRAGDPVSRQPRPGRRAPGARRRTWRRPRARCWRRGAARAARSGVRSRSRKSSNGREYEHERTEDGATACGPRSALLVAALAVVAAGCGGDDDERRRARRSRGSAPRSRRSRRTRKEEGAGQPRQLGRATSRRTGSTPFEQQTGCKVNSKVGASSDEMVTLMKTGNYDGVSASGDATLRLIAAGDVAPVNLDLIPNYAERVRGAQEPAAQHRRRRLVRRRRTGAARTCLIWNKDDVTPAPTTLGRRLGRRQLAGYKGRSRSTTARSTSRTRRST